MKSRLTAKRASCLLGIGAALGVAAKQKARLADLFNSKMGLGNADTAGEMSTAISNLYSLIDEKTACWSEKAEAEMVLSEGTWTSRFTRDQGSEDGCFVSRRVAVEYETNRLLICDLYEMLFDPELEEECVQYIFELLYYFQEAQNNLLGIERVMVASLS